MDNIRILDAASLREAKDMVDGLGGDEEFIIHVDLSREDFNDEQ